MVRELAPKFADLALTRARLYIERMSALIAKAHHGRLMLDVATDLPDGAEVELVQVDHASDLEAEDYAALVNMLLASEDDVIAGRLEPLEDILAELHRERHA